ncbi:hypothetical protein Gohar_008919, partial [Gossypium harknessii]|nr:hypothetical protein [Gossypium harknessii]
MEATRFDIEKLNGVANFNLWQVWMMIILVQTGLKNVFTGKKLENLDQTEVLMGKTSSALWKMLKTLYATKSLAN